MKYKKLIRDILFPPICALCGEVVQINKHGVCDRCRIKLPYISEPTCFKCGKEISDETVSLCEDCSKQERKYLRGFPVFNYNEDMQESIVLFKYKNKRMLSEFYAGEIYKKWAREFERLCIDVLVPVPVSKQKLRKRGYNQAKLICEKLGEYMGVPVDDKILVRTHNTAPMKNLNNQERYNNLKNAFKLKDIQKNYNNFLIIDDIYTTGATIDTCTKLFNQQGKHTIYYASVCIGKGY